MKTKTDNTGELLKENQLIWDESRENALTELLAKLPGERRDVFDETQSLGVLGYNHCLKQIKELINEMKKT